MLPIIIQVTTFNESIKDRCKRLINHEPEIVYLIKRLTVSNENNVILATTNDPRDNYLEQVVKSLHIGIYRGPYGDVLSRLLGAARFLKVDHFIRVYGNYPLVDINQLHELAEDHLAGDYDYSYNEHRKGVLWGTGCDVFRTKALELMDGELCEPEQREMVAFYLQQNTDKYHIYKKEVWKKRPGYKLNFETEKDLNLICELAANIPTLDNEAIIEYLESHQVLTTINAETPPKEVGLEKILFHSGKIQDILKNGIYADSYPISVELTLTNQCNLRCVYCSDQDLRVRQGVDAYIGYDTLSSLFQDLSRGGTKGVVFEGGGEPTLHPDFERLVLCAKENHLGVGLITNGTVHLPEHILENFEWIRVSLDASNAEEYLRLKKVDCFQRVLSNISYYAQHCDTVGVGYVVTNNNMSNIEELILQIRETGVSYVQLRPVVDMPEMSPDETDLKYLEVYTRANFNVIVDGMRENMSSGNEGYPCVASSITSIISGDGSVYLCGRLNIYDWIAPIGNIKYQSFSEIWEGDERKRQLKMIGDGSFCSQNCPQCRISKFNQLFRRLSQTKSVHFV